jgi:hypothetical protein
LSKWRQKKLRTPCSNGSSRDGILLLKYPQFVTRMIDDITDDRVRADRNISFPYWCIFMALRREEMKITGSNVQNVRDQTDSKW